jgi:hypothetical protein
MDNETCLFECARKKIVVVTGLFQFVICIGNFVTRHFYFVSHHFEIFSVSSVGARCYVSLQIYQDLFWDFHRSRYGSIDQENEPGSTGTAELLALTDNARIRLQL